MQSIKWHLFGLPSLPSMDLQCLSFALAPCTLHPAPWLCTCHAMYHAPPMGLLTGTIWPHFPPVPFAWDGWPLVPLLFCGHVTTPSCTQWAHLSYWISCPICDLHLVQVDQIFFGSHPCHLRKPGTNDIAPISFVSCKILSINNAKLFCLIKWWNVVH